MGDLEEVMDMGKKFNMNMLERKKYKVHIDNIRYNQEKAAGWRRMNYLWQLVFFGTLFIEALAVLFLHLHTAGYLEKELAESIADFIKSWFFLLFGFLMPFSFPLMMWSGTTRSKWENALTRSTAYALSFLENIEHRIYLEEKMNVWPIKKVNK